MDLIYANERHEDLGVLCDYKLDLAYGVDENDFELQLSSENHCCDAGYILYIEGTEYGGMIDSIESDTAAREVKYIGRTWHGLLNSKVIEPDAGAGYLTVSGEVNKILGQLVDRMGLSDIFIVSKADSKLYVSNYQMHRYVKGYDGIRALLDSCGGKLSIAFINGVVELSALPRADYTACDELDSDLVAFKAKRQFNPVNHLICLGRGELADREVIHLYADKQGTISKVQSQFGLAENTEIYDYPNVESLEDLERSGMEQLEKRKHPDSVEVSLNAETDCFAVQDIVRAVDHITGLTVTATVAKKIVTIDHGQITISYNLGGY